MNVLQLNELVVGDTSGKLLVYKNDDSKPWITRICVGMVSPETAKRSWVLSELVFLTHLMRLAFPADLCCSWRRLQQRKGRFSRRLHIVNTLVAMFMCGGFFPLFDRILWLLLEQKAGFTSLIWQLPLQLKQTHPVSMSSCCLTTRSPFSPNIFLPTPKSSSLVTSVSPGSAAWHVKQLIVLVNLTAARACTVDGDGRCELVVGYTDRVVRAFRWEEPSDGSDPGSGQLVLLKKWLLEGQVDLTAAQYRLHSCYSLHYLSIQYVKGNEGIYKTWPYISIFWCVIGL